MQSLHVKPSLGRLSFVRVQHGVTCLLNVSTWHVQAGMTNSNKVQMHSSLCIQGQAYSDPGATVYDAVDGAITAITVKGLSAINTMVVSF